MSTLRIQGISYFVLVLGRLDLGVRPTVDAELLVRQDVFLWRQVGIGLRCLWPKRWVLDEHAGPWVIGPQEG